MSGGDEEVGAVGAGLLVILERGFDPVAALWVGAFADEHRLVPAELLGGLGDALVHLAEEGLRPSDVELFVFHRGS